MSETDNNEVATTEDSNVVTNDDSTEYKLNDKVYNIMKWLAMLFLPALATFIATVGNSVTWSYTSIVCTVITALAAFLGAICGISSVTAKTVKE